MNLDDLTNPQPTRQYLLKALGTFTGWLGDAYDCDAMVAAAAITCCEHIDGDTPRLLIVSGSGLTKTETVTALRGAGAHITSTITSEGALLSATSKREKAKDATGGLLRVVGDSGVVVIKDVTSILSMVREMRAGVLAALREVADGYWERNVGTDGGKTLTWSGRCIVVGAVTTSWDKHHGVVAEMGDRFLLLRMDSGDADNRRSAGKSSLRQTGKEKAMRLALSDAVSALIDTRQVDVLDLTDTEEELLLSVADIVTRCRTAVERDFRGTPEYAHALEAPTRLAKYLWMMTRGAVAIGATRDEAFALAVRVASDSLPPNRRAVLLDVARNPLSRASEVARRLQLPYATTDRTLQELHLLGALVIEDADAGGEDKRWRYSIADAIDSEAMTRLRKSGRVFRAPEATATVETAENPPEKSVPAPNPQEEGSETGTPPPVATDISGETSTPAKRCAIPACERPTIDGRATCADCAARGDAA